MTALFLGVSRRNIAISPPGLATVFPALGVFGDLAKGIMTIVIAIVLHRFVLLRVAVLVVFAMALDSTVAGTLALGLFLVRPCLRFHFFGQFRRALRQGNSAQQ